MPPFSAVPCSIYFYYVRLADDGRIRVDHFFYNDGPVLNPGEWHPIQPSEVAALLPALVANARLPMPDNPPVSGANFQDVVWTRKSHLVILVDEEHWHLHRHGDGGVALAFNVPAGTPNHSFFDAQDIEIEVPDHDGGSEGRSAIALINHMKRNAAGDDLMDESQAFDFNIYLEVRYAGPGGESLTVILDPDGQNQGPPIGPP